MFAKNTMRNLILIIISIVIVITFILKTKPFASPKYLTLQASSAPSTRTKPALRASIDTNHLQTGTFKIPAAMVIEHGLINFLLVSAASLDEPYIALADYSRLYCFNTQNASLQDIPKPQSLEGIWRPTGLAYNKQSNKLYIANYNGNNILEGTLNCNHKTFTLNSVIASPETISPENITLSADGQTLISANYDGNSLVAFKRQGNTWKKSWVAKVPLAHGVAIKDDTVFASSLQKRAIYAFSLTSGQFLKKAGQIGNNALESEFLWPTSLLNFHGKILVTDAHAGQICVINQSTLLTEVCFGGNGLGADKFNMPYGIAERNDHLLIASTFSSSLIEASLHLEKQKVQFERIWFWTGNKKLNAEYLEKPLEKQERVVAFSIDPYSSACNMPRWLQGYTCHYSGLMTINQLILFPTEQSILNPWSAFYFIKSFKGKDKHDFYFYSPQSREILNVRLLDEVPYLFMIATKLMGMNLSGKHLVSPLQTIDTESIEKDFETKFSSVISSRDTEGIIPLSKAKSVLVSEIKDKEEFQNRLISSITAAKSKTGDRFLKEYLAYHTPHKNANELRQTAFAFAEEQLGKNPVLLDRVIIPCMLTNAKCGNLFQNRIKVGLLH